MGEVLDPDELVTLRRAEDYLRCKRELKEDVESAFRFHENIKLVISEKLYKDEYGSFEAFCQAELKCTRQNIYRRLQLEDVKKEVHEVNAKAIQTSIVNNAKGIVLPIPGDRHSAALARLPESVRQEVWRKACEQYDMERPGVGYLDGLIQQWIRDNTEAAAMAGQCMVNGHLVPDTQVVSKLRAAGKIPRGEIPVITMPEKPRQAWTKEEEEEALEEAKAMAEADLDETWLSELPLTKILTGVPLRKFRFEALLYRDMSGEMGRLRRMVAEKINKHPRDHATFVYHLSRPFRIEDPKQWVVCPPRDKSGCGGRGELLGIGKCMKCHGCGYLIPGLFMNK